MSLPNAVFDVAAARAALSPLAGKGYDVAGLFEFLDAEFRPRSLVDVCSPVAAYGLSEGGIWIFNKDVSLSKIKPVDLHNAGWPCQTIWDDSSGNPPDLSSISPGAWFLYRASDVIGDLIDVFEGEDFSHVELYLGGGQSFGARFPTLNFYPTRVDQYLVEIRRYQIDM